MLTELRRRGFLLGLSPTALLSCKTGNWTSAACVRMDIAVVSGDEWVRGKPDPEIFRRTAARLGVACRGAYMWDDPVNDGRAKGRDARFYINAFDSDVHPENVTQTAACGVAGYRGYRLMPDRRWDRQGCRQTMTRKKIERNKETLSRHWKPLEGCFFRQGKDRCFSPRRCHTSITVVPFLGLGKVACLHGPHRCWRPRRPTGIVRVAPALAGGLDRSFTVPKRARLRGGLPSVALSAI